MAYCTEDTPYNKSTATSLSDLSVIDDELNEMDKSGEIYNIHDGLGCSISFQGDTIQVVGVPEAGFTADSLVCAFDSILFEANNPGNYAYLSLFTVHNVQFTMTFYLESPENTKRSLM